LDLEAGALGFMKIIGVVRVPDKNGGYIYLDRANRPSRLIAIEELSPVGTHFPKYYRVKFEQKDYEKDTIRPGSSPRIKIIRKYWTGLLIVLCTKRTLSCVFLNSWTCRAHTLALDKRAVEWRGRQSRINLS
jgi:hypothetical protein